MMFWPLKELRHLVIYGWCGSFMTIKIQKKNQFRPQVRPPRLGGNKKIGVFATRSMYRPSPIGLSVVRLKCVKKEGKSVRVYVTGSDLLDGTPIVDIKPYIHYSDAVIEAESGYAQDEPKRKSVIWSNRAIEQKQQLLTSGKLSVQTLQELEAILSLDPRPAYQDDEARVYKMKFAAVDIAFTVGETTVNITAVE